MGRSLSGSRVLVLGGSSGIGLATAKAAAAAGAKVTLASRSNEKVNAAVAEAGTNAQGTALDTTNDAALETFFSRQAEWDHIVVSVAAGRSAGLHDLSLQDAYGNMNAKFWTAYKTAKLAKITPGGSLTLVSGFLSHRPNKDALLQGCINAALESLGRGLALALSPVRVNTVSPGLIDTPIRASMPADRKQAMLDHAAATLPARRVGQAEDVADAILMLMTNPFTTGSTLFVDGGGMIS
ncbi:MAG TPA: SDR family oxidoreductase [Vicinamibacterales bacterium]|jgi:NAD(P)-dependent dehydrogenase (short-subunit alcohol dehydrogenase family)|nr:SDR family oxidoreductase [Vicinamibacterales bacterium]